MLVTEVMRGMTLVFQNLFSEKVTIKYVQITTHSERATVAGLATRPHDSTAAPSRPFPSPLPASHASQKRLKFDSSHETSTRR